MKHRITLWLSMVLVALVPAFARAEGDWEVTLESEQALQRGLEWLHKNQGGEGNWGCKDLGIVSLGALAFLAAGHTPGRGEYGRTVQRALDYVLSNARPSGLLNITDQRRDMYNHGLSTFVLGQAHGMTTGQDRRLNSALDRALRVVSSTQCDDGGWDYVARARQRGNDLSLAVMQAKALRSAMDSGLEVPPSVVELAIKSVREHYSPQKGYRRAPETEQMKVPGQFTYQGNEIERGVKDREGTVAMAAAGVVCLQEFGQYDDWRIPKSMEFVTDRIKRLPKPEKRDGKMPFDSYTLYYVGQALYQVGGNGWQENYPVLRDYLVNSQIVAPTDPKQNGRWGDQGDDGASRLYGKDGELFGTSVACFILAIPNRYLPILQEGRIESFRGLPPRGR